MNAPPPDVKPIEGAKLDPRRYFERVGEQRTPIAAEDPVCLYLETTNRCNLLCTTCPRTFEELEPPSDMSWELFTSIVDQYPNIQRVVLHGVGEPMMVAELPRMVKYLKDRGVYALFNTNGTLMREKKSRELIEAGLDEMRISLDAAEPKAFEAVRGRDLFQRILRNIKNFVALKKRMGAAKPRLSLWLTGLRETLEQLPAFIRLAHDIGVPEVHLQRLVYFENNPIGLAQPRIFAVREQRSLRRQISAGGREDRGAARRAVRCVGSGRARGEPRPARCRHRPGRFAAAPGRSCTSQPTAARCPAASRRSPCMATRISPLAMPRPRRSPASGTAPDIAASARRY